MNNFLTGPVRIQVRNNRSKSRDSPPWILESRANKSGNNLYVSGLESHANTDLQ